MILDAGTTDSPAEALAVRSQWEDKLTRALESRTASYLSHVAELTVEHHQVPTVEIVDGYTQLVENLIDSIEVEQSGTLDVLKQNFLEATLPDDVFNTASEVLTEGMAERMPSDELNDYIRLALSLETANVEETALTASVFDRLAKAARGMRWKNKVRQTARTGATEATGYARLMIIRQNIFYTNKRWITRRDDKVRITHHAVDGQAVPKAAPFQVGSASLMYPGEGNGPPEEVKNCRCVIVGVGP